MYSTELIFKVCGEAVHTPSPWISQCKSESRLNSTQWYWFNRNNYIYRTFKVPELQIGWQLCTFWNNCFLQKEKSLAGVCCTMSSRSCDWMEATLVCIRSDATRLDTQLQEVDHNRFLEYSKCSVPGCMRAVLGYLFKWCVWVHSFVGWNHRSCNARPHIDIPTRNTTLLNSRIFIFAWRTPAYSLLRYVSQHPHSPATLKPAQPPGTQESADLISPPLFSVSSSLAPM